MSILEAVHTTHLIQTLTNKFCGLQDASELYRPRGRDMSAKYLICTFLQKNKINNWNNSNISDDQNSNQSECKLLVRQHSSVNNSPRDNGQLASMAPYRVHNYNQGYWHIRTYVSTAVLKNHESLYKIRL
jgi:hypothetical protein